MKKVLLIYYTQSGQLAQIADNFIQPFINAGIDVEKVSVKPKVDYQFPWSTSRFFDVMPESVRGILTELEPFTLKENSYDLVIFAYQPWFLSPSIPANSILHHSHFQAKIKNTPVVTLIGARNMWLGSQERVKSKLKESGADLVGNVVLYDRHSNLVSVVTIFHWMLGGKKDRYLNIFPVPGVAEQDINGANQFGNVVLQHLNQNTLSELQEELVAKKAVEVKYNLMFVEETGQRIFKIWAALISKRKNRKGWLIFFKYYLLFALFIVSPIVLLINNIFFRPFKGKSIKKKINYYLGLNNKI